MTNNTTKRALISSAVALALCFVMLVGTTFAWFTDEVSSDNNIIKTGTLDIELYKWVDANDANKVAISESSAPLFGKDSSTTANADSSDTLWEPGKTQTVYLSIKNNGTLDLKYTVVIEVTNIVNGLNEVLTYVITPDAHFGDLANRDAIDWTDKAQVESGINFTSAENVALTAGAEHFFALSVHMDELAGNEYQNGNITFNIKVLAGQLASESDSFDNQYDADATYPDGFYEIPDDATATAYEFEHYDENNFKNGTIVVPVAALPAGASTLFYDMIPSATPDYIVLQGNAQAVCYDIQVEGLVEDNAADIKVEIRIPTGLDSTTISVYHNSEKLDCAYDADNGMVTFYTKSFSPFTVVYGGEAIILQDTAVPVATVTYESQYVGLNEGFKSFGNFAPTVGKETCLDAAFKFVAPHDSTTVDNCSYKDWYCDFYVSLDRDLGENQIFLAGNYGSYDWVGFHNGELTLEAGQFIPLLGAATSGSLDESNWTYDMIVSLVKEFGCGVGDVNGCLEGATFTVQLRVTNPENTNEHIVVNEVKYTFGGDYSITNYTPAP